MVIIITYQDFLAATDVGKFVKKAINDHKGSEAYKTAYEASEYYAHRNVTIRKFQKWLFTVSGKQVPDIWTPNYKMACNLYGNMITDKVHFLLGNGIKLSDKEIKKRLGTQKFDIDSTTVDVATYAKNCGEGFGFWNYDHVEPFSLLEFVPLLDETNGALSAGIRFWQLDRNKPLRATLYEIDGYTDYIYRAGKPVEILHPKRAYKLKVRSTKVGGDEIYGGENYPTFPIVPMFGSKKKQSEFVGCKEQIDCYDLIKSGFANTIDEAEFLYWTIENAGGMDDVDLAKWIERMKSLHTATTNENTHIEAHTMDVPYEGRSALLDRLESDWYRDTCTVNTSKIANVTATEIASQYAPMNKDADEFEYCVLQYLQGIFALAGIEDENPTFEREIVINKTEAINNVLAGADHLSEKFVTTKLLYLLDDGDKVEEVLAQMSGDDMNKLDISERSPENETESGEDEE